MKVLFTGDEKRTMTDVTLCLRIRFPGMEMLPSVDYGATVAAFEAEAPDLVIIDSSLRHSESTDLVTQIRKFSRAVPVLVFIDAEGSDMIGVRCLEAGADECVKKPFDPMTFLAVVGALLRRCQKFDTDRELSLSFDEKLTVSFNTHEVILDHKRVRLTPIEFRLFTKLAKNEGQVLTPHDLLLSVWGLEDDCDVTFVKKYIYRLRTKLERDATNPQLILTERGIGYRFARPPSSYPDIHSDSKEVGQCFNSVSLR